MYEDAFKPIYEVPKLQELLFRPPERYRTVRLEVRLSTKGKPMTEAVQRQSDYEAEHGMTFYLYTADARAEDRASEEEVLWHSVFFDSEERACLWHERPDRWRAEAYRPDGSTIYEVADGRRSWQRSLPEWPNHYQEVNREGCRWWPSLSLLVDPEALGERLFAEALVRVVGRDEWLGRETLEAEAKIRSRGYPPDGLSGSHGADTFLLSVDARTGIVLRFAERFESKEFYVAEVSGIALDEQFSEDAFRPGGL